MISGETKHLQELQRKKTIINNFCKFCQEFCCFSVALLSSIEYYVFLSLGGQDQPVSLNSSNSLENLISTEVENHSNDHSPTYCRTTSLLFLVTKQSSFLEEFPGN